MKIRQKNCFIIIVILGFFLSDRTISFLLDEISSRSQIRFSKLYSGTINADVVVLGDSRGVNSFYAPLIKKRFGFRIFNLSYNGVSLPIAKELFFDYIEHNRKPGTLILEITCMFESNDLLNNLKQYMDKSGRIKELFKQTNKTGYYATLLCHTFRYNSEYFLRSLYYINKADQDWINRYRISRTFYNGFFPTENNKKKFSKIDPDDLQILREILEEARKKDIKVRLFISPYLDKFINNTPEFKDWKKLLEKQLHYKIWDYSSGVNDWRCFADIIHLNYDGAKVLLAKLEKDGFFNFKKDKPEL